MLRIPAYLPHPSIGFVPDGFQVIEELALQRPARLALGQPAASSLMQGIHDFAVHVELALLGGGIADAHRF